jgi:hypothetical protein
MMASWKERDQRKFSSGVLKKASLSTMKDQFFEKVRLAFFPQ